MANSGVEFLERGQQAVAVAAPAGNLEECCKLPSGVRGGALAQIDFYVLFGLEMVTGGNNSH